MKRFAALILPALIAPTLGGCALQMAMAAAELASNVPLKEGASNAALKATALETCRTRAAQYGTPFVIDVEQRRADLLIVWGSVTDAAQHRRSFECRLTTRLESFRLREIGPSK